MKKILWKRLLICGLILPSVFLLSSCNRAAEKPETSSQNPLSFFETDSFEEVKTVDTSAFCNLSKMQAEGALTFLFSDGGISVSSSTDGYEITGTALKIKEPGTYILTGACADGSVTVEKETTDVFLILGGLLLTSSTGPALTCNKSSSDAENHAFTMNLGNLYIFAQGDGIDSNGTFHLNGGTVVVFGPSNGGNSCLDVQFLSSYSGGTVVVFALPTAETVVWTFNFYRPTDAARWWPSALPTAETVVWTFNFYRPTVAARYWGRRPLLPCGTRLWDTRQGNISTPSPGGLPRVLRRFRSVMLTAKF